MAPSEKFTPNDASTQSAKMRRTRKSNWLPEIQQFVILNASPVAFRNHAMPKDATPTQELHGWKAIAAYLLVSVRKAQDLEKERGLPVRRGVGPKAPVFAIAGELDTWKLQALAGAVRADHPDLPSAGPEDPVVAPDGPSQTLSSPPRHSVSRRLMLLGGGGVVAAAAAIGLTRVLRPRTPEIVRAGVVGNALCAWDASGALAWKHQLSEALRADWPIHLAIPEEQRTQIVDLGGNGNRQVIFAAALKNAETPLVGEIYCFSSRGEILWRYRPEFGVRFGNDRFDGPWSILDIVFVPERPKPVLLLAVSHWTWRPGFVVGIGLEGRASIRFANAGNLYTLRHVSGPSSGYVIAGGVNNEYNAAALAVLRDGAPPSRSPQTRGTRFEVLDGPTGAPERYFLFPPSEVNLSSGLPYNNVGNIQEDGQSLLVNTTEFGQSSTADVGAAIYLFNRSIEPERVTYGGGYAAAHRQLQSEGKLNHGIENCPQLHRPVSVRRWDAKSGWTTVEVPFAADLAPGAYRAGMRPAWPYSEFGT